MTSLSMLTWLVGGIVWTVIMMRIRRDARILIGIVEWKWVREKDVR
jgi:hypothetical protein